MTVRIHINITSCLLIEWVSQLVRRKAVSTGSISNISIIYLLGIMEVSKRFYSYGINLHCDFIVRTNVGRETPPVESHCLNSSLLTFTH